ncbi:MAG: 16S rRNA (uracil(1498)-N(3))-methyltransferase [Nitrospirae bacterium]|nr:16S rRNA (uracil(1498)-N(3))-methyltransferase [Nitrospirota bacterium]
MTRLFLPPEKLSGEKIIIDGEQARYLSLVLRVKPGEQVVIFDGSGHRYICRVLLVHKKEVVVEKIETEPYSAESPVHITLAQGLPKSDKMDFIVQKATELGVRKVIPLITERSQVKHTEKIERWRKIALSASQQCGREQIPEIDVPVEFEGFVKGELKGGGIIFSEEQGERNLKKILTGYKDTKNITLLIGPEGGFTREEVSSAFEKGFIEASLGRRILRTETAPITAISIIQYELGDMG